MRVIAVVILLLGVAASASAVELWKGKVVGVADGDTLTVRRGKAPARIRLHGVDCPEPGQRFADDATKLTRRLALGKIATVETMGKEGQRAVARVVVDGKDLSVELLKAGLAWWHRGDADPGQTRFEQEARAAKRGLWVDADPTPPWHVRPPPRQPWSEDRACKRDRDCVIAWQPCGYSEPICEDEWKSAVNRAADRRYQSHWANKKPACNRPMLCRAGATIKGRWLGTRAVCIRGQCEVR